MIAIRSLFLRVSLMFAAASTVACSGAPPIVPADKTFADAMGGGACYAADGYGEPLVVDWRPEVRGDLEVAMKDGVPVVTYDCKTLRLLPDCSVEGTYGFKGTTTKEQIVRLEDALELGANLPFSAGVIAGQIKQEATLDVAMFIIGKKMSTRRDAARSELKGRCQGATHFVRGVTLGAFAMETGAKGHARAAADVFGASASAETRGSKFVKTREGSVEDCKKANPESDKPPMQCASPLRLQLLPIGGVATTSAPEPASAPQEGGAAVSGCPKGLVLAGGKCTKPNEREAHLCASDDFAGCTKQCDAGDGGSCHNLSALYFAGKGTNKDEKRAVALAEKACEMGAEMACNVIGTYYWQKADLGRALSLFKRACDGGDTSACGNLGTMYKSGRGVDKNETRAAEYYRQACDGGNPPSCGFLAQLYEEGRGVPRDGAKALALQKRACDGHFARGCGDLGILYKEGKLAPKDVDKAKTLLSQGCDGGDQKSCMFLAQLYDKGEGVGKDQLKAFSLFLRACEGTKSTMSGRDDYKKACFYVGIAYDEGLGVSRDGRRAVDYYMKACEDGNDPGCSFLAGKLVRGDGVPRDLRRAGEAVRIACNRGYEKGCLNAVDIGDEMTSGNGTRDYVGAANLYRSACNKGTASGCGKLAGLIEFGKGGIRVDMDQAGRAYTMACEKGHANSCAQLGVITWIGKGRPRDPTRAISLFERACSRGDAWGCLNLSLLASFGIERKRSAPDAESLFDKACGPSILAKCETILKDDCEGGEERACTVVGAFTQAGVRFKRDGLAGVKLMTKGCAAGDVLACDILKKLGAPVPKPTKPPAPTKI